MYIGNNLQVANPSYKIIDDISSSFNGSTTSFALQVSGATPVPFPISTQQVMISVNGVIQEPDPSGSAGFKLLGSNIVFSSAPANGHAFFGTILAGADYVTAGSEFPDGSVTAPSFTFEADQDSGFFRIGSGDVGYSSNGVQVLNYSGNGLIIASGKGLTVDTNTLHVDATNNRVGIGLTAPATNLHVNGASPILRLADTTDPQGVDGSIGKIEFYGSDGSSSGVGVRSYIQTISTNATGNSHSLTIGISAANAAPSEVLRVDDAGRLLLGTTTEGHQSADDLTIATSGHTGMTLRSGATNSGSIYFSNATSGGNEYNGYIYYDHNTDSLKFGTNENDALTLDSSQRAGIGTSPNTTYKATIKNTTYGVLRLETDLTGGDGAYLDLMHNSSSPADDDNLGVLGFQGKNSANEEITYAQIRSYSRDVTDATEDGDLTFHTRAAGSFGERMRLDSSGRVLIGTTTAGFSYGDNLTIADSGDCGISIRSGTSSEGNLFFSDGTSGNDQIRGYVQYNHSNNNLILATNATTALTISSSQNATFAGDVGLLRAGRTNLKIGSSDASGAVLFLDGDSNGDVAGSDYAFIEHTSSGDLCFYGDNPNNDSQLKFYTSNAATLALTLTGANATFAGQVKVSASNATTVALSCGDSGTGFYNSGTNAIGYSVNGTQKWNIDSSGNLDVSGGTVSDSKGDLRKIPQNSQTSAYTLVAADAGKHIYYSGSAAAITVPANVFSVGDAITIISANSSTDITIAQGTSVTIYNAADGATGTRTLASKGMATLICVSGTNTFAISGAGLS